MSNKQGQHWQNLKKAVRAAAVKYPNDEQSQNDLAALRAVMLHRLKGLFRIGALCMRCEESQPAELTATERNACTLAAMLHHMNKATGEFYPMK